LNDNIENYLLNTWLSLEQEVEIGNTNRSRSYRRLDKIKDKGIRLSLVKPENSREMLIELSDDGLESIVNPNWMGMYFEKIPIEINKIKVQHLGLRMLGKEYEKIFLLVCADIVDTLNSVKATGNRIRELGNCLDKWNRFFKKHGFNGLSFEARLGLYGELYWIKKVIKAGLNAIVALDAWIGYKKATHDFIYVNTAVEVKTTATKEPRMVKINSEKQLDENGYDKLVLYILSVKVLKTGNLTLPCIIQDIKEILMDNYLVSVFEQQLYEAGYIKAHENYYSESYTAEKEELFHIKDKFPRITSIPEGTGLLSYSVVIAACMNYMLDMSLFIETILEGDNNA
jgi:hypothetical protein